MSRSARHISRAPGEIERLLALTMRKALASAPRFKSATYVA
jgi:hypothetical protein